MAIQQNANSAGMASLIKLVLALQHEEIPPHLHVTQPMPQKFSAWITRCRTGMQTMHLYRLPKQSLWSLDQNLNTTLNANEQPATAPISAENAVELLANLESLSDAEIDALLNATLLQGGSIPAKADGFV